jgi:hypothetical protein
MLCLIVVFVIVVVHRPSSIVHRLSSFVSLPLLVASIHCPLSAVMPPPFLPPFLLPAFGQMLGEEARARRGPGRGGNNKIEGGEGNECCVFLSLKIHQTGVTSTAHSHELRPAKQPSPAFDERWEKVTRAHGGGGLTRLGSGEGHFLAATDEKVI